MATTISPNMNLPVPTVGVESGPQWATDINACMTQIDAHNHTSGYGVPIPTSGLNINADLSFGSYNATNLRSTRFTAQSVPLTAASSSDIGCIYVSGVDLYYNDVNGNQVRITASGAISGTPGSITNLVAPASATYVPGSSTFVWQSAVNTPANMDFASAILRNLSASSKGLTLSPPAAMAADSTITLPSIPGSKSFMAIDNAGTITAEPAFANGLTSSNIAVGGITNNSIASATLTGDRFIAGQQIARTLTSKTSNYTATPADSLIQCGSGTAAIILFDPILNPGYTIQIKKTFSSLDPITITGSMSFSSNVISLNEILTLQSTATAGWLVINRDYPRAWIGPSNISLTASVSNPTKGSASVDTIWYRREGNTMICRVAYKQTGVGSAGSGAYFLGVPAGWQIDANYVTLDTNVSAGGQRLNNVVGTGYMATNTDYSIGLNVVAFNANAVTVQEYSAALTAYGFWSNTVAGLNNGDLSVTLNYQIPITNWL